MSAHSPATAAKPGSLSPQDRPRWFAASWDVAVALLLLALVGFYFGLRRTPVPISRLDDFDFSFTIELVAKTQQGLWLGRDAVFTYGPLCQWIYGHLATLRGQSLGDIYLSLWMFELGSVVVLFYAACALFLGHQPAWKRAFCLLLLVVFWVPITELPLGDIKRLAPLVTLGIFLQLLRTIPQSGTSVAWRAGLAAAIISLCFLFSGDDGVYAIAALAIVMVARLAAERGKREALLNLLRYALWTTAAFAICVVMINAMMGGIFDFHFWRGNYEVVSVYRWTENFAMPNFVFDRLLLAFAIALAIFAMEWWRQRRNRAHTNTWQRTVLWSCLIFALLGLQPAAVRGDWVNVSLALTPLIALALFVLMGAAQTSPLKPRPDLNATPSRPNAGREGDPGNGAPGAAQTEAASGWRPLWPALIALALTAALSGPNHVFIPQNLVAGFQNLKAPSVCTPGTSNLDGFCLNDAAFGTATQIAAQLAADSSDKDSVAVFPYQNLYAFLAKRRVAGAVLQNYLEAGDWLTTQQIDSYDQSKPARALFFADGIASGRLNQVPNFTREPAVWLYLQRWYSAANAPAPGAEILARDAQRGARWKLAATPLPQGSRDFKIEDDSEIAFAQIPSQPLDFLRVRLKLSYPLWWKVLKPSNITFTVHYADGNSKNLGTVVEPGKNSEVWIYPWREEQLLQYFAASEDAWRDAGRPAVTGLSVKFTRADVFSVLPEKMEVSGVDAVRVSEQ